MSLSNAAENAILLLIFNATTWDDWAEDDSSTPTSVIEVALHTGDPGEGGAQTTTEATYGGYARVDVARTGGGWAVAANSVSPIANIDFPAWTATPNNTITYFSLGANGDDIILCSGTVSPSISVVSGVTPRLTTATAITLD